MRPRWWIDGSYGTHGDLKGHSGGVLSLGKGAICCISVKQKINTRSSTEAELVAVHDVMPQVLWVRLFLMSQGVPVSDNIIYQDNQSAILLEKNGKRSSGKKTRHIDIRYFFVTDRAQKKEVRIEYCPTSDMTGDYFTKALQGKGFVRNRKEVMNTDH